MEGNGGTMRAAETIMMEPIDVVLTETKELCDSCVACYTCLDRNPAEVKEAEEACRADYNRLWDVAYNMLVFMYPDNVDLIKRRVDEYRAIFQKSWNLIYSVYLEQRNREGLSYLDK